MLSRGLSLACCLLAVALAVAPAAAQGEEPKGPVIRPYGLLKLDAAYDDQHTSIGNFVRWVEPEASSKDDAFHMTANQSRLGFRLEDLAGDGPEIRARVEIDFYGGGAENKPHPMMRHAYFTVTWPESGLELLAGQTSDLISPRFPDTLNYSVAWWAGNIGYRRPQVRLTRRSDLESGGKLEVAGAVARSLGDTDSEFTAIDSGADAGVPSLQARVGWSRAQPGESSLALGLSAHWGEEELDVTADGASETFSSHSVNLDWKAAWSRRGWLEGELFQGRNLSAYLGGIGQGVERGLGREIDSRGGWISCNLVPSPEVAFHLGVSLEDVEDDDLTAGDRTFNRSIFSNAVYTLGRGARLGVELSYWTTEYQAGDRANSLRGQLSLFYGF